MKLCVVGNGPSAKGKGAEIHACDFVVRMKAWWVYGAEDAGLKCSAWAHFACPQVEAAFARASPAERTFTTSGETWMTHTVAQMVKSETRAPTNIYVSRLEFVVYCANGRPIRWWTDHWQAVARDRLGSDPSSGFVTVCMAMMRSPKELHLYGFDATTPDRPNFDNARIKQAPCGHDFAAEKRAMAEIAKGTWLGQPTTTKLIWPDKPEGL